YFHIQPLADTLNELVEDISITIRDTACFFRTFTIYLVDSDSTFTALDSLAFNGGDQQLTAPTTSAGKLNWSGTNATALPIGPVQTMVYSDLMVDGLGTPALQTLIDASMLESVCVNVEHPWLGDLGLYLFAPNGQFIELSTENGANGDNYENTCFSPTATQSIKFDLPFAPASAAPFTGSFQPEGSWNDLVGAPLEGIWRLGVIDDQMGQSGQLINWSLSFSGAALEKFKYHWSTGDTTKTVQVSAEGTYSVTVSNTMGSLTKTFVLYTPCGVVDSISATIAAGETYQFGNQSLSQPGYYTQAFVAANGCDSLVVLHLQLLSGVSDPTSPTVVNISPNPTTGETWLSLNQGSPIARVRVFDLNGKLIVSQKLSNETSWLLKTSGWTSGWYLVELEGRDGSLAQGKAFVR
ncbi:MAG: proprotein convertase P-domain-containing protein, partial [Saprospiraceae bacterium]|nr:proprotein convertase P-domain-containing protein [Saprospiraceae bacterium]